MSEQMWIDRAQSAEAQLKTLRESQGLAIQRIKDFKQNFGIKERGNGEIEIDFPKFVERLGEESAAELRKVIDEKYSPVVQTSRPVLTLKKNA
jgi:hypothetical protein